MVSAPGTVARIRIPREPPALRAVAAAIDSGHGCRDSAVPAGEGSAQAVYRSQTSVPRRKRDDAYNENSSALLAFLH